MTPVDKKTRTGRALSANPSQPLSDSVTDQLAAIPDLSRNDLIERWTQAYSRPPPRGLSRRLLEYAAAYQIQARRRSAGSRQQCGAGCSASRPPALPG